MKRPARAHILALLTAFIAIVAVTALWIVNLKMGPPLQAWTGGATLIFVPMVLLILTAVWFVIRGVLHGRVHWRVLTILAVTVIGSLVIVVVTCGPTACFLPSRSNYFMGWFVVGGLAFTAIAHHLVLEGLSRGTRHVPEDR